MGKKVVEVCSNDDLWYAVESTNESSFCLLGYDDYSAIFNAKSSKEIIQEEEEKDNKVTPEEKEKEFLKSMKMHGFPDGRNQAQLTRKKIKNHLQ